MKLKCCFFVLSVVFAGNVFAKTVIATPAPTVVDSPSIKVLFTPGDDVQVELSRTLSGARKQILVQAYLLTDNKISDALIAAHKRGVKVQVLMDAERERDSKGSDARRLTDAGIKVRLETVFENAHNKVMIIDQNIVVTGSYNFTHAAQHKNAENILFIKSAPQLVERFTKNWHTHNANAVDFK
jgi:phosphatidylserine/phosphatidylglycerophosphate/cardiolipin synthase-like enzyme